MSARGKKNIFENRKEVSENSEKCQCAKYPHLQPNSGVGFASVCSIVTWLFVLLYTAVCSAQGRGYGHASLPIQLRGTDVSAYQLRLRRGIQMKKCCSAFALLQHQLT